MDTSTLSALHAIMVNIDEGESVDDAVNHDLDGDGGEDEESLEQWKDNYNKGYHPEADEEYDDGQSNYNKFGDPINSLGKNSKDVRYEDDPWGIGEGDHDVPDDIQISKDEDFGQPDDIQLNERDVREMTNKIWEAMDDERLDPRTVAEAALSYLSESDVAEMARMNEWFTNEEDDDFDDDDDDDYRPERPMF